MTIVTVQLPPGLFMNGTPYERKGRWADGNRVRWHNSEMRPIGGWIQETKYNGVKVDPLTLTPETQTFRDGFTWTENSGTRLYLFGGNDVLKALRANGDIVDVTPAGFPSNPNQPTINQGYGKWLYGLAAYGSPRPIDPDAQGFIYRWCFDTWGENVLCGSSAFGFPGGLYLYDVQSPTTPAAPIPEAPSDLHGFVVTDQRVVMGIGSATEPRLVRWSDRENYTDWTPTPTNWAGEQYLQGTGRLVSIKKVLNQVLILSENEAHVARFIGAPFIYGFDRIGNGCGPWNAQCVHVTDRFAMWPGRRQFWMYDGTLRSIPCDLLEFLSDDVDLTKIVTAYAMGVPQFNEIWWCYASGAGDDVDSYVAFDYTEGHWSKGRLERTCGVSGEVYVDPRMVDYDGKIYQHEQQDILVTDATARTGPIELGQGEVNTAIRYIYPDTLNQGDVAFKLHGKQFPTGKKTESPVYAFNNPVCTRMLAREIEMEIIGANKPKWNVGSKTRIDIAPAGTGKR